MPSIVLERTEFYHEVDDGSYPLLSYITYKLIEESVLTIPVTLVTSHVVIFGLCITRFVRHFLDMELYGFDLRHRAGVCVRFTYSQHGCRRHSFTGV